MTKRYVVIGSGPSGVHAALTLLERGKTVHMLDVGRNETEFPAPNTSFHDLKSTLADPIKYFYGKDYSAITQPGMSEIFTYPPARNFLLRSNNELEPRSQGRFHALMSHHRGGLGLAWGANCVPFAADDMKDFPISIDDLAPYYEKTSARIPISGVYDDEVNQYIDTYQDLEEPIRLNQHDKILLNKFERNPDKTALKIGRSRLAVSSKLCTYCDRCLWGCTQDAIYNPLMTLASCQQYENFTYENRAFVSHLTVHDGKITSVCYFNTKLQQTQELNGDTIILAAGAIGSAAIFLRTLANDRQSENEIDRKNLRTKSLLDTQTIKMPYVLLNMIGRQTSAENFQFNKLISAYQHELPGFPQHIHAEILSLSSLIFHPIIRSLPFSQKLSQKFFFQLKSALGVVTCFMPDKAYGNNSVKLGPEKLEFEYEHAPEKALLVDEIVAATKKTFRQLGCYMSERDVIYYPPGSGIHYAGTIPMSAQKDRLCVDKYCRSYAYNNLYVADGASFPSLPSKSITFSLMANASRVASLMP